MGYACPSAFVACAGLFVRSLSPLERHPDQTRTPRQPARRCVFWDGVPPPSSERHSPPRPRDTRAPTSQPGSATPLRSGTRATHIVGCQSSSIAVVAREGRRRFRLVPLGWALVLPPRQLLRAERNRRQVGRKTDRSGAT